MYINVVYKLQTLHKTIHVRTIVNLIAKWLDVNIALQNKLKDMGLLSIFLLLILVVIGQRPQKPSKIHEQTKAFIFKIWLS